MATTGARRGERIDSLEGLRGEVRLRPPYPAAYPGVVAVTAVSRDKLVYRMANRGEHIDFAAPGVQIRQAAEGGGYSAASGTSLASPFVAAVLAISADRNGRVGAEQLATLASAAEDLGRRGFDPIYGHGLIRPLARGR